MRSGKRSLRGWVLSILSAAFAAGSGSTVDTDGDSGGLGINGTLGGATWVPGAPFDLDMPPDPPTLVAPPDGGSISDLSVPLTVHVSDPDSDLLTVTFYGRKLMSSPGPPFTIIALPDTQLYSKSWPAIFTAQTQWILNNRDSLSIAYVGHEGDIIDSAFEATQWENADISLSIFDNLPDLPFGLCVGNHDEYPQGDPNGTAAFNTWFPHTRYASRTWYGGHYGADNDNHYVLFSAGGMDFIAIHVEYDPSRPAALLTWAAGLLQTYFNRRGMLVAHSILDVDGNWTSQGSLLYDTLKVYPNLFLMLCGHRNGEARRTDVYNGWTVHTLLADYQDRDLGGDGWLRILQFVPGDNRIDVTTYSPTRGQYEQDADSQFSLTYDMNWGAFVELGTLMTSANSDVSFTWTNIEPGKNYEWYAAVSDGHADVNGPVWSYTSVHPPTPVIALSLAGIDQTAWIHRNPAEDVFTVVNAGVGTLAYTITDDADWLSVSPASGSSSGEADPIQVEYNLTDLPVGTHTAIIVVVSAEAWNSPQTIPVTLVVRTVQPDFDNDGDVDQEDFGRFQVCLTGQGVTPPPTGCGDADLDGDQDVDQNDLAIFQGCLSGANIPADPNCAD